MLDDFLTYSVRKPVTFLSPARNELEKSY